jgi:hypothetical protein
LKDEKKTMHKKAKGAKKYKGFRFICILQK